MNQKKDPLKNIPKPFDGNALKWFALVCMTIDHITVGILKPYASAHPEVSLSLTISVMNGIGRLAFPIFAFLLVEGFLHTKDVKKYGLRLLIFALIAEVPFDLVKYHTFFDLSGQNVFFTLVLGLILLYLIRRADDYFAEHEVSNGFQLGLRIFVTFVIMGCAAILHTDYNLVGICVIVVFYIVRQQRLTASISATVILALLYSDEFPCLLANIPICMYNGMRGRQNKYLFYVYYPLHLLVIALIAKFVFGLY